MKGIRMMFYMILGTICLCVLFFVYGILQFGGIPPFLAYLNGDAVYIFPQTIDLGSCEAGTKTVAVFHMQNLTASEISVVGEQSSCSCAFSEKIPISAPPGKTVEVRIGVHLPNRASSYDQTVTLMVACPKRLAMYPVRVLATVPQSSISPDSQAE